MTAATKSGPNPDAARAWRVAISCPGCGRHDYVLWPAGQPTYHWKCFNCSKEFDLERAPRH